APSSGLRDRCQRLLAAAGVANIGLRFYTLSSFAQGIFWDAGGPKADETVLSDSLFFDTLVRQILKRDKPFPGFAGLAVPDGFPPSVRATLRDLGDAGVEPEKLLEAVNNADEFNLPEVDLGSLKQLIHLHRLYLDRVTKLKVLSRSDVLKRAADAAAASPFLKGFSSIVFYGFYDLTGLQAELFESVSRAHPTEFFLPYFSKHPDWTFAARFRGDVLDKIPHEEEILAEAAETPFTHRGPARLERVDGSPLPERLAWDKTEARVFSVSGLRDEAWIAAGEILRLHDVEKIPYSEMAVVARARERLVDIADVFRERGIPFVTAARPVLGASPQVGVGLELAAAEAAASPLPASSTRNPEVLAAESSGAWPETAAWSDYARRVAGLIERRVRPATPESERIWKTLSDAAASLSSFDRLKTETTREDFLETLRRRWMESPAPDARSGLGVSLLHAEAARGLSFEVVFLAGLEERVFPRVIREDPFLRDEARYFISHGLGHRISQKKLALDEERLLLHLIVTSARSRLYVSYQRSDEDGKIVGPSSFLRSLLAEWKARAEDAVNVVPRRPTDKFRTADPATLGLRDVVTGFLLARQPEAAAAFAAAAGRDAAGLSRALAALRSLETYVDPSAFDGLVGAAAGARHLERAGLSATGLKKFARCPFEYFVDRVVGVSPVETLENPEQIDARLRGELVHAFLKTYFERCAERYGDRWPAEPPADLFDPLFDEAFAAAPPIYPALWTTLREELRSHLWQFLIEDFADLASRGLRPAYFEQAVEADLEFSAGTIRVRGRLDRVDVGPGRARIVDYKSRAPKKGAALGTLILRGQAPQAPVYLLMAASFLREKGISAQEVDFGFWHIDADPAYLELDAAKWAALKKEAVATIETEIKMIAAGEFPMMPKPMKCAACDAAAVCRQADSLSAFRMTTRRWDLAAIETKKAAGR
ncbi:MAG: exodeoxyribonuclease V subunit gamma, partial [Elusimicrobia bacterium]|nr:exodeoxyribonuclease V subunit gamma [Elusimicrobiota bacterium]